MAGASTRAPPSSSASDDTDFKVPPTPVKNFGNRQKIQRKRNDSEDERHYASDDECSSDDDTSEQYHPHVSVKKQDLAQKAKLLKRLQFLGLAPRKHCKISSTKLPKERKLRKPSKKSPAKTKVVKEQEEDPLFPRPKFLKCEFCEKDYLTNYMLKKTHGKTPRSAEMERFQWYVRRISFTP